MARTGGFFPWIFSFWFVRSLTVGAFASLCDYSLLFVAAKCLKFPSPVCAMMGVSLGSAIGFLLNRTVAFKDCQSSFAGAAIRYAAAIGCLMLLHGAVVGLLTDRAKWPILVAKLVADVTILASGQLLLLRFVVFPRNKARPAPAATAPEIEPWLPQSPRASSTPINSFSPASRPSV